MQLGARPGSLSEPDLERFETAFQCLKLALLLQRRWLLGHERLQVAANEIRQCGVALLRDLTHLFDELILERKSHVHTHMIGEPRIMRNERTSVNSPMAARFCR